MKPTIFNIMWKDIIGFEGLYQINEKGEVKSLNYIHSGKEKILKYSISKDGYYFIGICKNGLRTFFRINRLVATEFIPNPEKKPQVNHKNGIKTDNRVENLEWVTASENTRHAWRTGLSKVSKNNAMKGKFGSLHHGSKKISQFTKGGILIREWGGCNEIYREIGICSSTISQCCNNKRKTAGGFIWKHNI